MIIMYVKCRETKELNAYRFCYYLKLNLTNKHKNHLEIWSFFKFISFYQLSCFHQLFACIQINYTVNKVKFLQECKKRFVLTLYVFYVDRSILKVNNYVLYQCICMSLCIKFLL